MTPERIAELREIANDRRYAWGVSSSTLTECLNEIERLAEALVTLKLPAVHEGEIRRDERKRAAWMVRTYMLQNEQDTLNKSVMDLADEIEKGKESC